MINDRYSKRVIFLDVDGVLNSQKFMHFKEGQTTRHFGIGDTEFERNRSMIDPEAVRILNKITDETKADLVISSTWRRFFDSQSDMRGFFKAVGVTGRIIGRTPSDDTLVRETLMTKSDYKCDHGLRVQRGHEIYCYLLQWYSVMPEFVILDDDSDMADWKDHLVQTRNEEGLTPFEINKVLTMFKLPCIDIIDFLG